MTEIILGVAFGAVMGQIAWHFYDKHREKKNEQN